MLNALIWGSLGMVGGVVFTLWLIGREDPPIVQALTNPQHFISAENLSEFAEEWQHLEERLEVSLGHQEAHHLLRVEAATKKRLLLVSMEDEKKQHNRFQFAKWLVDTGKMTEFPVDGIC